MSTVSRPLDAKSDALARHLKRKAYVKSVLHTVTGYVERCAHEEGAFGELTIRRAGPGEGRSTVAFIICAELTDAELSRINSTVRDILARKVPQQPV